MKTAVDPIQSARDQLHLAFQRAAAERSKRSDFDPETGELLWIIHERSVMHGTVNRIRAERGLGPVPLSDIEVVERSAQGHIDYAAKFVLRCADLTV